MRQSRGPETSSTPAGPEASAGMNQGMQVLSYLIAGIALYGGAGWAGDHWLGTGFLLPVGLVVGAALGMYLVIKHLGAEALATDTAPEAPEKQTNDKQTTEKGRP